MNSFLELIQHQEKREKARDKVDDYLLKEK